MIIQAIPGSGKSTLVAKGGYFDTDVEVERLGFKGKFDKLLEDPKARDEFFSFCRKADEEGVLLTNLNLSKFGMHVDKRFCYRPEDYLHHIALTDRSDLLKHFDHATLTRWAIDYGKLSDVTWMGRDKFLSDYL